MISLNIVGTFFESVFLHGEALSFHRELKKEQIVEPYTNPPVIIELPHTF